MTRTAMTSAAARNTPEYLDLRDGWARYRPQGEVTLVEGVGQVTRVITFCRERGVPRLLVDVTALHGYAMPTLADRFWMAQDWAEAARGQVTLVVVAFAEYIHPAKFGVMAAADAGLRAEVFASEDVALEWLLGGTSPAAGAG